MVQENENQKVENTYFGKYFESKFDLVHSKLESITDQVKKTEANVQEIIRTINQMQLTDTSHFNECPNTKKIEELTLDFLEFDFFKKYYKVFLISIVVFVGGSLLGAVELYDGYKASKKEINAVKTEVKTIKSEVGVNTDDIEKNKKNQDKDNIKRDLKEGKNN